MMGFQHLISFYTKGFLFLPSQRLINDSNDAISWSRFSGQLVNKNGPKAREMLIQHFQEEQLWKGEKEEGLLGHSSSSLGLRPGGLASAITGRSWRMSTHTTFRRRSTFGRRAL